MANNKRKKTVQVDGYTTRDGKVVPPYKRRPPKKD